MGMVSQLRQAATTSREGACTMGRTRISADESLYNRCKQSI